MVNVVYAVVSQHDFDSESRLQGLFATEEEADRVKEVLEEVNSHRGMYCYIETHGIEKAESFINNIEY